MINALTAMARQKGASDLHLAAGCPPMLRICGELEPAGAEMLTAADTEKMAAQLLDGHARRKFIADGEADCAWADTRGCRYRVNIFRRRGQTALVLRLISGEIPSCVMLGLPEAAIALAGKRSGLVLIGGTAGSGKSTTMAALLDRINEERRAHIITLEDPVEFLHTNKKSLISQRAIGVDTRSFASGLHSALREDPDVIALGELRDAAAAQAVLTAAETGHLVLATLHTPRASGAINRITDLFGNNSGHIFGQLAEVLQGILCQQLLLAQDGRERVAAFEILLATPALRQLIREGRTHQMESYIQTGRQYGMVTLEEYKKMLVRQGKISARALDADE